MSEKLNSKASTAINSVSAAEGAELLHAAGIFTAECHDVDGNLVWTEQFSNLVTTVGKNDMLDKYLAGSAYTGAFYLGLISLVGYTGIAAGDTASSHAGWTEAGLANAPTYSEAARPTAGWNAAAAGSKALSAAKTFSITGAGTIKGAFLSTVATKDSTTGILFSAGLFSTSGGTDKVVNATDTVTVSYTLGV